MEILRQALEAVGRGEPVVVATVVELSGHAPRGPGARMLIRADGSSSGSVGGGEVEQAALAAAREMLTTNAAPPQVVEVGTECGGKVRTFLEHLTSARRLFIVGAGHVGRAVAPLAAQAGFAVTVYEPSERDAPWDQEGIQLVRTDTPSALADIQHPQTAHVLVTTGSHDVDREWALEALERGFAGVGVIGSSGKAGKLRRAATKVGLPEGRMAALRCPVGLPIRAITPFEIAVAVVAELIELTAPPKPTQRSCPEHAS